MAWATGGTITDDGTYYYHTFTSSGTFTPNFALDCDYLVLGGGGSGGDNVAGIRYPSGGAGGTARTGSTTISTAQTVTVGAGGISPNASNVDGNQGGTSSLGSIATASGGKGGGDPDNKQGGDNADFVGGAPGSNSGGGGAGAAANGNGSNGGNGLEWPTGSGERYGGGGAGGGNTPGSPGSGGGGSYGNSSAANGTNGRGGGGGYFSSFGNGGSGVVIIRYLMDQTVDGPIAVTEEDDAASFTGTVTGVAGTLTALEDDDTFAASGYTTAFGTIAVTEEDDIFAASGQLINYGTIAVTESEDDTFAGVGGALYDLIGTIAVTEEDDTPAFVAAMGAFGTINSTEEADFVDANEDFFGLVTTNLVEQINSANRHSRLQIPTAPADLDPVARKYLDTTFRNIQDEFNRLTGFQFQAIDLIGQQIEAQQDLITTLIPLIPVDPSVPPPTVPPWTPYPTYPFPGTEDGVDYIFFQIPPCDPGPATWTLRRQNLDNHTWQDAPGTGVTGSTYDGFIRIPRSNFSDEWTYRIKWICNGVTYYGDPFIVNDDWSCTDPSSYTDLLPDSDLVAFVPKLCPPSHIEEAVTNSVGNIGVAYGGGLANGSVHYILAQPEQGGQVAYGAASAAAGANYPRRLSAIFYISIVATEGGLLRVGPTTVGHSYRDGQQVAYAAMQTNVGNEFCYSPTALTSGPHTLEAKYDEATQTLSIWVDDVLQGQQVINGTPISISSPIWTISLRPGGTMGRGVAYKDLLAGPDQELDIDLTSSSGSLLGTYSGDMRLEVAGQGYYYTGAWNDTYSRGGSLGGFQALTGNLQIRLGAAGAWQSIFSLAGDAVGGPFSDYQPGHLYTYDFNVGATPIAVYARFSDSLWVDNTGQWHARVWQL